MNGLSGIQSKRREGDGAGRLHDRSRRAGGAVSHDHNDVERPPSISLHILGGDG
jgi:hypothetical protein